MASFNDAKGVKQFTDARSERNLTELCAGIASLSAKQANKATQRRIDAGPLVSFAHALDAAGSICTEGRASVQREANDLDNTPCTVSNPLRAQGFDVVSNNSGQFARDQHFAALACIDRYNRQNRAKAQKGG